MFTSIIFLLALLLLLCAGASELAMSQWSSLFAERALGVTKVIGDLLGPCLFAVFMGIGRTIYGVWGEKKFMGRTFMGILRTTFVIDEQGVIEKIFDKVRTKDHFEQIVEAYQ